MKLDKIIDTISSFSYWQHSFPEKDKLRQPLSIGKRIARAEFRKPPNLLATENKLTNCLFMNSDEAKIWILSAHTHAFQKKTQTERNYAFVL